MSAVSIPSVPSAPPKATAYLSRVDDKGAWRFRCNGYQSGPYMTDEQARKGIAKRFPHAEIKAESSAQFIAATKDKKPKTPAPTNKGKTPDVVPINEAMRKTKKTPVKANKGKKTPEKAAPKNKGKTPAPKKTSDRKYGLDEQRAAELRKAKAYNAYRPGSSYHCVIEALHTLGVGKMHSAADLVAQYQKQCDKAKLSAFKGKEERNDNGIDWKARILQNAYVTTRADYGKRQRDIGWETKAGRDDKGNQTFGLFKFTK